MRIPMLNRDETQPEASAKSLSVFDLGFSYRSTPVLKDISFKIDEPSLVSIVGPNGVGKSTLVQCINRVLTPGQGKVLLNGMDVGTMSYKEISKLMGYVPCVATSTFPITVIDAVMMGRHPHAKFGSFDEDMKICYDTLDELGISDLAMRQMNELSAGQHQKVMIAKGLVQKPELLILDEPTANLDMKHQMTVTKLLRDTSRKERTMVLMICHDLNIAAKYSDRILVMSKGTIYKDGSPTEVITPEMLKQVYDIDAEVIMDLGKPHILLRDEEDLRRLKARLGSSSPSSRPAPSHPFPQDVRIGVFSEKQLRKPRSPTTARSK